MCIGLVTTVKVDGKKYTVILDQRDGDIAAKDLPFQSLGLLHDKYAAERRAKNLPEYSSDVHGLFSDSPYANGQFVIGEGRAAILADYRLHADDPRRKSGLHWSQTRGASAEKFVRSGDITTEYGATEHPHMMIYVDQNGDTFNYEFDGGCRSTAKFICPSMNVVQTCGSFCENFRSSLLCRLTRSVLADWDGKAPCADLVRILIHKVLGNTEKPSSTDKLLDLGKDFAYESHVESIRIPPSVSWIDPTKTIGWMTVASVACVVDHSAHSVFVASRHYSKPKSADDVEMCLKNEDRIQICEFPW